MSAEAVAGMCERDDGRGITSEEESSSTLIKEL